MLVITCYTTNLAKSRRETGKNFTMFWNLNMYQCRTFWHNALLFESFRLTTFTTVITFYHPCTPTFVVNVVINKWKNGKRGQRVKCMHVVQKFETSGKLAMNLLNMFGHISWKRTKAYDVQCIVLWILSCVLLTYLVYPFSRCRSQNIPAQPILNT